MKIKTHDLRDSWECYHDWRAIVAVEYGKDDDSRAGQWCVICVNTSRYHRSILVSAHSLKHAVEDALEIAEYVHNREKATKA